MENKKEILKEILNNENEIEILFDFFKNLYYGNDLLSITDSNSFNYSLSEIDIISVIESLNENNLKIIVEYDF